MKISIFPALVLSAFGIAALPSSVANAAIPAEVLDTVVTQPDQGYDLPIELIGERFKCTDPAGKVSAFDRTFYEDKIDFISRQQSAWFQKNAETGTTTPWEPVNPVLQNCAFSTTVTESNTAKKVDVTNPTYGAGEFNSTCDMERTTAVSFNYKMTIPLTAPSSNIGLLPVTSASSWVANITGFRNCAWSLSFNAGVDVVSGTIEQVFVPLPETIQGVSYDCRPGMTKDLCVQYAYASNIVVTGGIGLFAGAEGTGIQNETRTLSGTLINMPFETSGANAVAIASERVASIPVMRLVGVPKIGAIKSAAQKSVISLKLKKAKRLTVRIAGPRLVAGVSTLGNGPDGKPTKLKLSSAPKSSCAVTGKLGKRNVTLKAPVRDTDGAVTTSITSSSLQQKLKLTAGKTATLTVTCATGTTKVVKTIKKLTILLG
jgi:hypothetical protein